MRTDRTDSNERRWDELVEEARYHLSIIQTQSDDRLRVVWALKMIAEAVAHLDQIDRSQGYLPLEVRPCLMLTPKQAVTAWQALKRCGQNEKLVDLKCVLESYFEDRITEYTRNCVDH
ncbi:MAG: hypothetical protein ACREBW_03035 [Candidatus Micrarchaeaceae archaeon]